ncbi:hypothetical protein [Flavobacterium foetidum]|uniref:hypothetical protein n=1 Tax=Flavobacterium foetidum TaxID=2026681 RepID=UPI001074E068|nr:hypothetical protein [Flavobacterium foetidum]KAF2517699.1 hypothetical protein E0W73_00400 [Flavobacterium foetidum]
MKLLISSFLLLCTSFCFSQTYYGQIVTNQNDTLSVQILIKGNMIFKNNKILSLQEKITVIKDGTSKEYFPKDLKSFKIKMENKKVVTYDNINDSIFGERWYSNKVKLYYTLIKVETRQSPYFAINRVFVIKKPNAEKLTYLIPNGLSRLITQKEMLEKFSDCKTLHDKIAADEIKITNEEKLINFIIDYEKTCFTN